MLLTFSARRVSNVEDVWGDGVEVLGGVVQPVYHSLHAFLVVLYDYKKYNRICNVRIILGLGCEVRSIG